MKKVFLLVNPKSRQGQLKSDEIVQILKDNEIEITDKPEDADFALVAGGDGSVSAALPDLLRFKLPLLLVPAGTANNLARTLNLPTDLSEILALVRTGRLQKVDLGQANNIPFINLIGLGLSTQVNRLVQPGLKRWLGSWAFFPTALKVALRMTPFRAHIVCDDQVHRCTTWQITVCNGKNYGAGLTIDDSATLTDQLLHGLSTEVQKWWHVIFMASSFLSGRFRRDHAVRRFQGQKIRIETRRPMHVDIDGDIKTSTPLDISLLPKALTVFVPNGV